MSRPTLDAELVRRIGKCVRAGGRPVNAAEACGIPRQTLYRWLKAGRQPDAKPLYRQLWVEVMQARAHARLVAEWSAFKVDRKYWLTAGPGAVPRRSSGGLDVAAYTGLMQRLLTVLEPYPEARAALLLHLEDLEREANLAGQDALAADAKLHASTIFDAAAAQVLGQDGEALSE